MKISFPLLLAAALFLPALSFGQISGQLPLLLTNKNNGYQVGVGKLPVEDGDILGRFQMRGWVSDGYYHPGVEIKSIITGPVQGDGFPADMYFSTGYPGFEHRMVIKAGGRVGIGTDFPDFDLHTVGNTHTTGDFFGRIHFDDNQSSDDAPDTYIDEAYFELKQRAVLGLPAGLGTHGGLLSLAPGDASFDHQLFFAEDGVFHRRWTGNANSWAGSTWYKLLSSEDINGTPNRIAKFTGPSSLGDSQLFDDGSQVGIGTTNPTAGFLLEVAGAGRLDGDLDVTGSAHVDDIVTIGTTNTPASLGVINTAGYRLFVEGGVLTEEVLVRTGWADHVFETGYPLRDLDEVKQHIAEKGHLPDTPSAEEIETNGLPLGAATVDQQVKIEELFLYLIRMNDELQNLKAQNAELRTQLERLSAKQ